MKDSDKEVFMLTERQVLECGLEYDSVIADESGFTQEEIEDRLIRVFVATNKTMEDFSMEQIEDLIKMIMLQRYEQNLKMKFN